MLVFKVAKFALRHPLLTHSASRLLHKKLRPKKEATFLLPFPVLIGREKQIKHILI